MPRRGHFGLDLPKKSKTGSIRRGLNLDDDKVYYAVNRRFQNISETLLIFVTFKNYQIESITINYSKKPNRNPDQFTYNLELMSDICFEKGVWLTKNPELRLMARHTRSKLELYYET